MLAVFLQCDGVSEPQNAEGEFIERVTVPISIEIGLTERKFSAADDAAEHAIVVDLDVERTRAVQLYACRFEDCLDECLMPRKLLHCVYPCCCLHKS